MGMRTRRTRKTTANNFRIAKAKADNLRSANDYFYGLNWIRSTPSPRTITIKVI